MKVLSIQNKWAETRPLTFPTLQWNKYMVAACYNQSTQIYSIFYVGDTGSSWGAKTMERGCFQPWETFNVYLKKSQTGTLFPYKSKNDYGNHVTLPTLDNQGTFILIFGTHFIYLTIISYIMPYPSYWIAKFLKDHIVRHFSLIYMDGLREGFQITVSSQEIWWAVYEILCCSMKLSLYFTSFVLSLSFS